MGKRIFWPASSRTPSASTGISAQENPARNRNSSDPQGLVVLEPFTVQMISGVDAKDYNGDGDLDILTGQGHGGSGLRFYERDYVNDLLHHSLPIVTLGQVQSKR